LSPAAGPGGNTENTLFISASVLMDDFIYKKTQVRFLP
jgi:hypothetical protein